MDFGEAGNAGNDNNYVRIMTIHQSKGLQFPVVILGNSDKRFNEEDLKSKIIIDEDFGISMDYVDLKAGETKISFQGDNEKEIRA